VRKTVRLALMFKKIHASHVPRFGVSPRCVVERDSGEVAVYFSRNAIRLVFVISAGPFACQVHLSKGGWTHHQREEQTR